MYYLFIKNYKQILQTATKLSAIGVNKRKNRLTLAKLESKKHDEKVLASRVGWGWKVSNERQGRAMSDLSCKFQEF